MGWEGWSDRNSGQLMVCLNVVTLFGDDLWLKWLLGYAEVGMSWFVSRYIKSKFTLRVHFSLLSSFAGSKWSKIKNQQHQNHQNPHHHPQHLQLHSPDFYPTSPLITHYPTSFALIPNGLDLQQKWTARAQCRPCLSLFAIPPSNLWPSRRYRIITPLGGLFL